LQLLALQALISCFAGAEALGQALILLMFVSIGAGAGSLSALLNTGSLVLFVSMLLAVHLAIICLVGRSWLKLRWQPLLVASNANVGGPATAAAMAASRGWAHQLQPALITGSFGYAVGTPLGCFMGGVLLMMSR